MGVVKLEDKLHLIIEQNLKKTYFRVKYQTAKGFVDNAVYKLLLEEKLITQRKEK